MEVSLLEIAVVSDVTLGFGSPQIPSLARSLAKDYCAPTTVFEPDQGGRPRLDLGSDLCRLERLATRRHPHTAAGRIEYVLKVARRLNATRPDIVAVFCSYAIPVLAKLHYRPRRTIYAMIESVLPYGEFDVEVNRSLSGQIDLLISPEENRARLDIARCGLGQIPLAIAYNVSDAPIVDPVAPGRRMRRVFYGGAISRFPGLAHYFLRREVRDVPFDLFGAIVDSDCGTLAAEIALPTNSVSYHGRVDARTLAEARRNYAYSVVMYCPSTEQTHFACPNKLFESIADGVPPIAAPHPQCEKLLRDYRCGILMKDWHFESFHEAVTEAMEIFGTPKYEELVDNCRAAVERELNWETQYDKIRQLLPKAA